MESAVAEQVFYSEGGVLITNIRAVFYNHTYALANITSFKSVYDNPHSKLGLLIILIAVLLVVLAVSPFAMLVRVILVLIGIIAFFSAMALMRIKTYSVLIITSAQELRAITSSDESLVDNIISALEHAIVYRG
jgi:hypothetical protein